MGQVRVWSSDEGCGHLVKVLGGGGGGGGGAGVGSGCTPPTQLGGVWGERFHCGLRLCPRSFAFQCFLRS